MGKDELSLENPTGYVFKMILYSGGIKTLVWLDCAIGLICLLFAAIFHLVSIFVFWAAITSIFVIVVIVFAFTPRFWPFFLETNYLFKIVQKQMENLGDSSKKKLSRPTFDYVQPVITSKSQSVKAYLVKNEKITEVADKK